MGPALHDNDDDDDDDGGGGGGDTRGSSSFAAQEEQSRFQKNTVGSNDLILKKAVSFRSRAGSPLSSPSEG